MSIKGIALCIEDAGTGATVSFHRIEFYSVDPRSGQTTAHISGYVSETKQIAGRNPLLQKSITLSGVPSRGNDAQDWIYSELVKPAPIPQSPPIEIMAGMPMPSALDTRYVYADGALVHEDATA
jgi:hypothetical protein